jgi:hypothetical protein
MVFQRLPLTAVAVTAAANSRYIYEASLITLLTAALAHNIMSKTSKSTATGSCCTLPCSTQPQWAAANVFKLH